MRERGAKERGREVKEKAGSIIEIERSSGERERSRETNS